MEETKEADSGFIKMDNAMETANPCGDTARCVDTKAIIQIQCNTEPTTKDWDSGVLNHVLVQVLDEEEMDTNMTNEFMLFLMCQGLDNVQFVMTVSQEDFESMGHDINFTMFQILQALARSMMKRHQTQCGSG